ncbi:hypothetical protein CLV32_0079 [Pedobacter duraquae]|uniref:Uncharacterized protein n=1 Tax=Pedobacter duraquae TaxID=425511 RepID=A0A4R6ING3_9SPHI|nr:hypothetical protein CLV32_0079 [Pedobacter duraquae]
MTAEKACFVRSPFGFNDRTNSTTNWTSMFTVIGIITIIAYLNNRHLKYLGFGFVISYFTSSMNL